MEAFDALLEVAKKLNGPGGCPWDQTQTFLTLQPYVLEEAHEVIDAVERGVDGEIVGELGDLLYTVIFYCMVANKEGRFTVADVLNTVREKLVRRHPHVFGGADLKTADEVIQKWEQIKKEERKKKSALEGMPQTLPALVRAQKLLKLADRVKASLGLPEIDHEPIEEEEVGAELLRIIQRAEKSGVDCESALRRALKGPEERFRTQEGLSF